MEVKPGYKQTEVGVIPEDWEVRTFQSLAHIERGKFTARPRNDPKYYGGEIPFIQTGDVTNSKGQINAYSQTLNREGLKVSKLFPRETIFFTIAANIGDVAFAAFDTACPDSLVAIAPINKIDKRWLVHELRRHKASFENLSTLNAQLNLNLEKLRPYLLPVPSSAEQEAIAEALSDADALIESLEQLIAKKRQIKQGAMQKLLTGKKRLPGFNTKSGYKQTEVGVIPEDWGIFPLSGLGKFKNGINKASEAFGHGSPFVNLMDVFGVSMITSIASFGLVDTTTAEQQTYDLRKGDVIFIRSSVKPSGVGLTAVVDEDLPRTVYSGFLIRFRDSGTLCHHFKRHCFYEEGFRNRVIGASSVSANTNINQDSLKRLLLPLPPTKDEQTAIAAILSGMDAEITALEAKLIKARQIKQGMMQELLTGRIRLV